MGHLANDNSKLLGRVRRIKGQIEGVERALNTEKDCAEILRQIAAIRGAVNGLMATVIEDHIDIHVAHSEIADPVERKRGAQELIDVIRTYLK